MLTGLAWIVPVEAARAVRGGRPRRPEDADERSSRHQHGATLSPRPVAFATMAARRNGYWRCAHRRRARARVERGDRVAAGLRFRRVRAARPLPRAAQLRV